jgi:hypothetical protein
MTVDISLYFNISLVFKPGVFGHGKIKGLRPNWSRKLYKMSEEFRIRIQALQVWDHNLLPIGHPTLASLFGHPI